MIWSVYFSVFLMKTERNALKSLSSSIFSWFFNQKSQFGQQQEPKMPPMMVLMTPASGLKLSRGGVRNSSVRSRPWAEATGKGREGVKPLHRDWEFGVWYEGDASTRPEARGLGGFIYVTRGVSGWEFAVPDRSGKLRHNSWVAGSTMRQDIVARGGILA